MVTKDRFDLNISEKKKTEFVVSLLEFCKNELDVEIGNLGASSLYDHIEQEFAEIIYNKAIEDAKEYYQARHNEIDIDSYMLLK
ncbi:MAG: DUF2164 family protein [Candidatus Delongbacteria bacterium]|jgi:uncharacterized protein (DUF2164 family)|nr:DUF2164 family protein [Candidatus Delongbacteria bacterium]